MAQRDETDEARYPTQLAKPRELETRSGEERTNTKTGALQIPGAHSDHTERDREKGRGTEGSGSQKTKGLLPLRVQAERKTERERRGKRKNKERETHLSFLNTV